MHSQYSDKMIVAVAQIQSYKRRHYRVTCILVGVKRTCPQTFAQRIQPRHETESLSGSSWAWIGRTDDIAPGACQAALFPETVPAHARRAEVWPPERSQIVDGCFMAADNRKLIAGCNRFTRRTPDIAAHG